ncbi:flagellar hook-basal body complex protein FliE [Pseudomonas sp. PvR086]|nr:flagellar hook-basal body complex protein FliE [Pseudomonas sp. KD5]PZW59602.1 flagellar hook-basal body complex protein FliE [Pseudomonas sp. URMO17WK12:I6]CAH0186357.1 Flagellar hook-basal body complex protein FliE [Pseudomonas sp. Bi130]CAH0285890.1 Flagellar hook-basal body complex protein FliE [Pseudomonas sp. Bi123]
MFRAATELAPLLLTPHYSPSECQKIASSQREQTMSQGIEFNRLMLDMRAMQMDAMSAPKSTAAVPEVGGSSFADMLGQAVNKVNDTQQASNQLASAFEIGKSGVDLTDVMISSQKASVSFQALTQVRNKLVQAYQDIMQMPV